MTTDRPMSGRTHNPIDGTCFGSPGVPPGQRPHARDRGWKRVPAIARLENARLEKIPKYIDALPSIS